MRSSPRPPGHRALPDGPLHVLGEATGPLLAASVPLMLSDSLVATAQLSVAHLPRSNILAWRSIKSPVPEVTLRAEILDLTRALQMKSVELQRVAQPNAEAQNVVAAARAEVQRLSDEETNASRAVGIVQQQAALRAGYLGEHAQESYALRQRECLAVQSAQEAFAQQHSAFHNDALRLRAEFDQAERVFDEMQKKDLANQQELQQTQALAVSGQATAASFAQYEPRAQLAVSDLKNSAPEGNCSRLPAAAEPRCSCCAK